MNKYAKSFYEYVKTTKEYECIGTYIKSSVKIKMRHKICDYEWDVLPNSFKSHGSRCPRCYGNVKKTNDDFLKELSEIKGLENYVPLEKYKNNRTPIKFKHMTCGNEYMVTPYKILKDNNRCPYCSGRIGHDYFDRCSNVLGDEYIVLTKPKKHIDKVKVKHLKCDSEFILTCNKILNGRNCPFCKMSYLEQKTEKYIKSIGVKYSKQYTIDDCIDIIKLRYDFALDINDELILIECQGRQHYENVEIFGSFTDIKRRDDIKRKYCTLKGIKLIEIPYYEENNIENFLNNQLGITNSLNTGESQCTCFPWDIK